jgi:predicted GNAT family N-acyltransferase
MNGLVIKQVAYQAATTDIQTVRTTVFQIEQGVDSSLDFDGLDPVAHHIVAYLNQQPVGTARIRLLSQQLAKIERVAVISSYRGQGIGQQMMVAAIDWLKQQNIPECKIHAQTAVVQFYQNLGFQPWGEVFDEAGIPHLEMRKTTRS